MPAPKTEPQRCFVDTNIWLYALVDISSAKHEVAKPIVSRPGIILSTQVINETCVNLLRRAAFTEANLQQLVAAFYEKYTVADVDRDTLLEASRLRENYSLSFWDSIVVASALRSDCEVLYTEDMQHGLEVDGQVTIMNPFAAMRAET